MKKNDLRNQTTEQLTKSINTLKGISGALIIMIIIVLSISIYGLTNGDNNTVFIALLALGASCSVILIVQFLLMTNIRIELESRKTES